MANTSIKAAFERMWQHTVAKLAGKKTDDGGEIFNDYNGNIAHGKYTHSEGSNTQSGTKGFPITKISGNTLTLDTEGFDFTNQDFEVGDIASVYLKYFSETGNVVERDPITGKNYLLPTYWGLYKVGNAAYPALLNGNSQQKWMFHEETTIKCGKSNSIEFDGSTNIATAATALEGLATGKKYIISFKYYIPSTLSVGSQGFIFKAGVFKKDAPLTNAYTVNPAYALAEPVSVSASTGEDNGIPIWKSLSITFVTESEQYLAISSLRGGTDNIYFSDFQVEEAILGGIAYEENSVVIESISTSSDGLEVTVSDNDFLPENYTEIINDEDTEFSTLRIPAKPTLGTRNVGMSAHAEGENTRAYGACAHTEGQGTKAGYMAHAEGQNTHAKGKYSHTEGRNTEAFEYAHAEGASTKALGYGSHSEGSSTTANGRYSHTEGYKSVTEVGARGAHAEGWETKAIGDQGSHAEGSGTIAGGIGAHAEGSSSKALGSYSHSEGGATEANNVYAHSEGYKTLASGQAAHAEGNETIASGAYSHAGGHGTRATAINQTAIGAFNAESQDALFIVGNGIDGTNRSNALEVNWKGEAYIENGKKVATKDYVDEKTNIDLDYLITSNIQTHVHPFVANALKGYTTALDALPITDFAPFEHDLNVKITLATGDPYNLTAVRVNQFDRDNDEVVGDETTNTNARQFNGHQMFVGISANNYLKTGHLTSDGTLTGDKIYSLGNTICVTSRDKSYGLGFDVPVEPNTTYTIKGDMVNGNVSVVFFGADGHFLQYVHHTSLPSTFTTTVNTHWVVIILRPTINNQIGEFENIQILQEDEVVANISPIATVYANEDGTIVGLRSTYPTGLITSEIKPMTITCEYNRDINKAFEKLEQAIISLGGNI